MHPDTDLVIIGAGIAGLTLELHCIGVGCRILERAPMMRPVARDNIVSDPRHPAGPRTTDMSTHA